MTLRAPDLRGQLLSERYRLERVLGEGSFGVVYRGFDERLHRPIAVKVIKPWWAQDPGWVGRFAHEARAAAALTTPGVVQVYDTGEDDEAGLYIVGELVDGQSLDQLAQRSALALGEVCRLVAEVLDALQPAHERGIVHRDIKPQNVLVAGSGAVKVTDFGIAQLVEATAATTSATGTVIGTPTYMSPEQARGRAVSAAADIYSVGVMLYELLAGRPPFVAASYVALAIQHLNDPPPGLPEHVPPSLAGIVERALAKEPADRFANALSMAAALRGVATVDQTNTATIDAAMIATKGLSAGGTLPGQVVPQTSTTTPPRRSRRLGILAGALVALVALVGTGVTIALVAPWDGDPVTGARSFVGTAPAGAGRSPPAAEPATVTVPRLVGLPLQRAQRRAQGYGILLAVVDVDSRRSKGSVLRQGVAPGGQLLAGRAMRVEVSAGAAPVTIPRLIGRSSDDAQHQLRALGLTATITTVRSAHSVGEVLEQQPSAGAKLEAGGRVELTVAGPKSWRPVTEFTAEADASSDIFTIHGSRWRISYTLTYRRCDSTLGCDPPRITVEGHGDSFAYEDYTLSEGTHTTSMPLRPGRYSIALTAGFETPATVTVRVEDWT